jgi:hypothetical protein
MQRVQFLSRACSLRGKEPQRSGARRSPVFRLPLAEEAPLLFLKLSLFDIKQKVYLCSLKKQ